MESLKGYGPIDLCIESIGLAAYMIMQESSTLEYRCYNSDKRCFCFSSRESEDFWANKYDLSKEKQHDSIVLRLRNLKR
jgi:hypothetical protein